MGWLRQKSKKQNYQAKLRLKSTVLLFFSAVLAFSISMPNQTMALVMLNQSFSKETPSVLPASKVDYAKGQAVGSSSTGVNTAFKTGKRDSTPAYEETLKRTPFTSTYVNKDGTRTLNYSILPQNYLDSNNKWQKIDNSVETVMQPGSQNFFQWLTNTTPDPVPTSDFNGKAGRVSAQMKSLSDGLTISANGKTFIMKPIGAYDVMPEKMDDHTVVYKDVWPHVDLQYELRGELVKETIVVKDKSAQTNFNFDINGGRVIQHPTRVGELTIQGMPEEYSFSPLSLDVNGQGVISEQHVTQSPTENGISVSMDKDWMQSQSDSSFPMRIDPTFGPQPATSYWMYRSDGASCGPSTCYANTGSINSSGYKHWQVRRS